MIARIAWAGFVMLAASSGLAFAQSTDRPEWKVGDRWVFRGVENPGAKESRWTREVVSQLANGNLEVLFANGNRVAFDPEANSLDKRGPEYTWRRFKFPMSVGMSWKHERTINGGTEKSSWKVLAREKITVPAGTFDCFKVEGEAFRDRTGVARGSKLFWTGHTRTTYWYCPVVKWAAKWEIEDIAYPSAPRVITVSELVSFQQQR